MPISSAAVRKGQWIQDEWGKKCRVESKTAERITTRRYDKAGPWDCVATWTYDEFDGRTWSKARPSKRKGT